MLQSVRKALPAGQRQSQEIQVLPDQPRITRLDPSTRNLVGWEMSVNPSIHEPQKQAGGEKQAFDSLWQKEITPLPTGADMESDNRAKTEITRLPRVLPTPHRKDSTTLTRVIESVTQTAKLLTPQWQEGQQQKDVRNSLIRQRFQALPAVRGNREVPLSASNPPDRQTSTKQVSRYVPRSAAVMRLDALPLARRASSFLTAENRPRNLYQIR
jgi:hypothetical protein